MLLALLTIAPQARAQTQCAEGNGLKYVQWPNLFGGLDVWDSSSQPARVTDGPWWLADDFTCTTTGPITDIHLWGSWQNDRPALNKLTFQLYVLDDVATNSNNLFSHPGTNVIWHQTFPPGSYSEAIWTTNASEYFLDPGQPAVLGGDSVVWYYCFYPTNLVQSGTASQPRTYWLVAFAELPTFITNVFGWKTTTNLQHDISVHAPWLGFETAPLPDTAWARTYEFSGGGQPLDLAFKLTTVTNNPLPCCPDNGGVKYSQSPNLSTGTDVNATFFPLDPFNDLPWVLADDFPCTNSGPITDIHLWGSWLRDRPDTNAVFTLAIWSDVPTNSANPSFSHPGTRLWSETFSYGQYVVCLYTNTPERFTDAAFDLYGYSSNLYYLCFNIDPSHSFYQTGTPTARTNYWLSATVQSPAGGDYFGWKSSWNAYNDVAVAAYNGNFYPLPGDWFPIADATTGLPLNLAFKITTLTNQCPPPTLLCSNMTAECGWPLNPPLAWDNCCHTNLTPLLIASVTNSGSCPWIINQIWAATDCAGQTAICTNSVTIVDTAPPTLTVPAGGNLGCNPQPVPNDAWFLSQVVVTDNCCVSRTDISHSDTQTGCTVNRTFYVTAFDCCSNSVSTNIVYTWTTNTNGPALICAGPKVVPCDGGIKILHYFTSGTNDPAQPYTTLVRGSDGALYGTSGQGGSFSGGTVFKVNSDGSGYAVLHSFSDTDGWLPGELVQGSDGALYGACQFGGGFYQGTVFKLNPDGSGFTVLRTFAGGTGDGAQPAGALIEGKDGALYGTTSRGGAYLSGTVFRLNRDGTGFALVHSFAVTDGEQPMGRLLQPADGLLYGITPYGGPLPWGTVFRVNPDGTDFTLLHNFSGGADGLSPNAGLEQGSDGALYGTTSEGGAAVGGTVFKMDLTGSPFVVLHSFSGYPDDGDLPVASLIQGSSGILYGTTSGGGANNFGTVFQLNPDGTGYALLHNFRSETDGAYPDSGLLLESDGALYGTTRWSPIGGAGAIFKLAPSADWPFDTPTAVDSCCGTNVTITILGTVTNGSCPQQLTRTWLATGCCSNQSICSQTVTLVDTNPPTLRVPEGGDLGCNPPPASIPDDASLLSRVLAIDNCCLLSTKVIHSDSQNGCLSTRTFFITASDCCSNSVSTNVAYTWTVDTTGPEILVPAGGDLGCNPSAALIPDNATVLSQVVVTDACCVLRTNVQHLDTGTACTSNRTFAISAWDCCSNSTTRQVVYTWTVDTTPPAIVCPSNRVVAATSSNGAVVTFTVTVSDNCDPNPTVTCTPMSGSLFPIGTNAVVCLAVDDCGNSNRCSFTVTVVPVPRLVSVGSADGTTIGVRFDMELDQVLAETAGNYTFDIWNPARFVNCSNALLRPNGREVELTLDQRLPAETSFSVTASNISARDFGAIKDPAFNGQAGGRVLRFNTVAIGDPTLRIDAFTADNKALELTGGGGAYPYPPYPFTTNVDNIAFTYRWLSTDSDVVAMAGLPAGWSWQASSSFAGLMVRDSLSSTSRMAALVFDPAQAKGIWFVRSNDGGTTQVQGEVPLNADGSWLRLRRVGDTLTALTSTNGIDWSVVGFPVVDGKQAMLVGFAVGSTQAREVAGLAVPWFQYRNYYLQLGSIPGGVGFSWYGPGKVEETSSLGPNPVWSPSAISVEENADERWVIFENSPPPWRPSRFFRVVADPRPNQ